MLAGRGLDEVTAQESTQVVQIGLTGNVDDRLGSVLDEVVELCSR